MKLVIGLLIFVLSSCGKDGNNFPENNENNSNNENNGFEVDLGEFENNDPNYFSQDRLVQFNYDYYRTFCERLITCRDTPIVERFLSQRGLGSFEACLVTHVEGNNPQRWLSFERQERTLSVPTMFEDCLEGVGALTCEETVLVNPDFFPSINGCEEVFRGRKETNQPCESYIECPADNLCVSDGFNCEGTCSDEPRDCECETDEYCNGVSCAPRVAEGESCDFEGVCEVGTGCSNGTCQAWNRVDVGDACDGANYCPIGSRCWNQTCIKLGKRGDSCSLDEWCDLHLSCNDGTCGEQKKTGACEFNFECLSLECDPEGQCVAPEALCINE